MTKREKYGKRPHTWNSGPDEYKHSMYVPWMKMKAQANFRNEPWDLSFEEFFTAWNGQWEKRGRASEALCMTRIDYEGDWNANNIVIITRKEHCQKQSEFKTRLGLFKYQQPKPPLKKRGRKPKPVDPNAPVKVKRPYVKKGEIVYKKMKVKKD